MKEAIKIRVNNKQNDVCTGCGKSSKDEKKEFYDMMIGNDFCLLYTSPSPRD